MICKGDSVANFAESLSPILPPPPAPDEGENVANDNQRQEVESETGAGAALADLPSKGEADLRNRMHRICSEYLDGSWRLIAPKDMTLKKVSGGLSNLLYYCALPASAPPLAGEPSRVLLRLYGQILGERALETLITESVIFTLLSESQRGPRLFGVFPGGRLEEYIPARPLRTEELANPRLSSLIALKVAQIHLMAVPISKEPRWLWDTMERWLSMIEDFIVRPQPAEQFKSMIDKVRSFRLRAEISWLRSYLESINSPVVFCHNDLQEGNILLRTGTSTSRAHRDYGSCSSSESSEASREKFSEPLDPCHHCPETPDRENGQQLQGKSHADRTARGTCGRCARLFPAPSRSDSINDFDDQILVIDFEYCSYNYRGFDFANHMCEWMYDYSNEQSPYFFERPDSFPTREQQELFVRAYLTAYRQGVSLSAGSSTTSEPQEHIDIDTEVIRVLAEVRAFTLASHLFWALWSVVNSSMSTIAFDYWGYGDARFRAYFQHKEAILADFNSNGRCANRNERRCSSIKNS